MRKRSLYEKYIKRLLDIIFALLFLILFCWLYAIIALLVRIKMGSPVIFRQQRPGMIDKKIGKEKIFELYKFRSMLKDQFDANGEIINGAHRLSACIAYGRKCPVVTSKKMSSGGSNYEVFLAGNIHPAVAHWGMSAYLRLLPDGPLACKFAAANADEPFPDWSARAKSMASFQLTARLRLLRYRLVACWRRGRRREKVLSHIDETMCRMKAYQMLAEYWSERETR